LVDPTGRDVFSQYLSSDPGLATATVGGTYTLVVAGRHTNTDASLDIPLRVDPISTTVQPLPLNTEVSQTTTVPQQPYEYTFTLDREAVLYFDSLTDQPPSDDMGMGEYSTNSFQWKLVGPEGVEVVDRPMHQSDAGDTTDLPRPGDPYDPYDTGDPSRQGVIQNLTAGDYTLTVTGTGDMTGDFGFRLLDLATTYPSVTPDTPLVSNLSPARETDAYQFDVSAGQRFSFDITSWSGPAAGRLRVVDRFGNVVVSTPASASAVTATLWLDGTYTVLVEGAAGDDAASRGYTLDVRLTGTDPLPELGQTIAFEQVVRDTLDSHTDKDVYSFTGQRHQRIYIDSLLDSSDTGDGVSLVGAGRVSLIAPSGKVVVDAVTSSTNIGPVELLEDGVYRLRVHTANAYDTTGDYAFRLLDLADQPTAQLDAVNGGTLTEAGFDHLFVYQGQPGERIVLRSDPWTTADTVALQSKLFSTRNGLEDGYYAIDRALNEVPQRDNVPLHVILVTDEDRYVHARNLTFASTLDDLQDRGATLHSLLDTVIDVGDQLDDDDGEYCPGATVNGAIGLDGLTGTDHAYYPDGNGGFTIAASGAGTFTPRCSPGENLEPFEDYGDLALQTFGTVWDLNQIELNANSRQSFSSAFVDAVVGQIEQQVGVTLRATDPTVQFEIVSTGGSARDLDFEVRFIGDGQPHSFDLQFVRTADPSVVLGSIPVTITTAYGYDVDAIDADNDVLTYELVGPTHGARLDAETGVMSWGPAAAGEYQFTTKVTDGRGGEDSQSWTVQVDVANADNQAPVFTAVDPLQVESDRGVTIDATATDPDGDQLFYQLLDDAAGGAALPAGVSINSATGAVTWTPTRQQVGTHTIKVQVSDGHGGTAQLPIDIEVVRPVAFHNQRPEILSQPLTAAEVGDVYRYPVIAIDGDGDPISFDLSVAPAGMSIHSERGIIAWRPTRDQLGQQTVIVRVRDDQGGVGLQAFDIIVTSLNDPPQITSEPNGPAATGEPWEYQLAASDPNGDLLVYSLQAASSPSATSGSASAPPRGHHRLHHGLDSMDPIRSRRLSLHRYCRRSTWRHGDARVCVARPQQCTAENPIDSRLPGIRWAGVCLHSGRLRSERCRRGCLDTRRRVAGAWDDIRIGCLSAGNSARQLRGLRIALDSESLGQCGLHTDGHRSVTSHRRANIHAAGACPSCGQSSARVHVHARRSSLCQRTLAIRACGHRSRWGCLHIQFGSWPQRHGNERRSRSLDTDRRVGWPVRHAARHRHAWCLLDAIVRLACRRGSTDERSARDHFDPARTSHDQPTIHL